MVKNKARPEHAWRPLRGSLYKAVIRIHYSGSKRAALADVVKRPPFGQGRTTDDYDDILHLREDFRYFNLPPFHMFEVQLNKYHRDAIELWVKAARHGEDVSARLASISILIV